MRKNRYLDRIDGTMPVTVSYPTETLYYNASYFRLEGNYFYIKEVIRAGKGFRIVEHLPQPITESLVSIYVDGMAVYPGGDVEFKSRGLAKELKYIIRFDESMVRRADTVAVGPAQREVDVIQVLYHNGRRTFFQGSYQEKGDWFIFTNLSGNIIERHKSQISKMWVNKVLVFGEREKLYHKLYP